jgi:hypothetical protein
MAPKAAEVFADMSQHAKITARGMRPGLPELSFCRKFGADFWSAWRNRANDHQPKLSALEFNTNRQARTS